MVNARLASVSLLVAALAVLVLGCGAEKNRYDSLGTRWGPKAGVLADRMQRERANNSLVFVQDRVGSWVKAVGRVHQVLPDGTVVFRETGGEVPDLWCAPAISAKVPRFKKRHIVVLHGQIVDFVPDHGVTQGYLHLRECEFLRMMWEF